MFSKNAKHSFKFLLMSLCSCFFLISCGGGGGDGGGTPASPTIAITGDNAVAVAAEIFQSGSFVIDSAPNINQNLIGVVSNDQAKGMGIVDVVDWQMEKIGQNKGNLLSDSSSVVGVVIPSDPVPCDPSNPETSGTYNFSWNVSNINAYPSVGDSVSITYDNCSMSTDGSAGTIDGSMNIKLNSIDSNNYTSFDVGVSFSNLQMNLPGATETITETINGDMRLEMTISGSETRYTASGNSLSYTDSNNDSRKLTNYSMYSETLDGGLTWTYRYSGTLLTSTQVLDGTFSFKTTEDLTGLSTDNLSDGLLEVTGAKPEGAKFNSRLRVMVNNTQVQLEIDANGDGVYEPEATQTVDWSQLGL